MKKSLLLSATLAMLLGVGVAVGARQGVKMARADGNDYGTDWYITGTYTGGAWGTFEKIATNNETLHRYEFQFEATDATEFKIFNAASYDAPYQIHRGMSGDYLDYNGKGWQSLTDWATGDNFKIKTAGSYIVYFLDVVETYDKPSWAFGIVKDEEPDVPESDGYYLVGSKTDFKYKDSIKMLSDGSVLLGNDAEYYGYEGKKDETIKVRQYVESESKDEWSFFVANEYSAEIGEADSDSNFKFSKDATIDIFAKWEKVSEDPEKWQINFYVSEHAERYTVSIYNVLFEGSRKASTASTPNTAIATEGVNFEYDLLPVTGYYARGLFTDADCTVAYVPPKITQTTTIYAKYTRLGYYVTGDANYAGSAGLAWNVDGATYLTSVVQDPNNILEGSVTIPNSASAENKIKVKPLEYVGDDGTEQHGQWDGVIYTLGAEYSFVELDEDSNLCFSKGGTYAVYVNSEFKAYLNEGADAFYTKFLNEVGGECNAQGNTNLDRLKEVWAEQEAVYTSLNAAEKEAIEAVTIDGGNEEGSDLQKVIAKYSYIVKKYGTTQFKDFIWGETYAPQSRFTTPAHETSYMVPVVVIIAVATVTSIGFGLYMFSKKKEQ